MEKKMSNVKPIIFSGPMVRAILDGRKTQTRRVLKAQPPEGWRGRSVAQDEDQITLMCERGLHLMIFIPYAPGDILYVRETMGVGYWPQRLWYDADKAARDGGDSAFDFARHYPRISVPSIHMPRWASRLTLEVTQVRVQRLQEISCADAIAEGIRPAANSQTIDCDTPDPRHEFRDLWNSINAKRGFGWDANPWVAAVTFKVHKVNVDEFLKAREAA